MAAFGRIHSFESFGTLDGPGVRFVVFLQGCALRCKYCHNPDTWNCAGGTLMSAAEVWQKVWRVRNFVRGGLTISGGEPLLQVDFTAELVTLAKQHGMHTAIDTSGSVLPESAEKALIPADLLLLDIKAIDTEMCRKLTGQGNENALKTLDWCEARQKPVWIRHVLVPEWTLLPEQLNLLAEKLRSYRCIERIELLPFHKMAEFKWRALNLPNSFATIPEPSTEALAMAYRIMQASGKTVIG